jgi:uncharacterized protein (DUF302 family)
MMNDSVHASDVVTKLSPDPVAVTVDRLRQLILTRGMRLFDVIDQAAEARRVGLTLRDTTIVLFGSPEAGTPVMAASPLSALDLPLKVAVWDDNGQTRVSYYGPAALAARHRLGGDLARNLSGVDALTDVLVCT